MAGAGDGAIAATQNDAVDYARDHNVIVVRSTRTGSGRVARGEVPSTLRRHRCVVVMKSDLPRITRRSKPVNPMPPLLPSWPGSMPHEVRPDPTGSDPWTSGDYQRLYYWYEDRRIPARPCVP